MLQHFHGSSEEGCVIEMLHRSTRGFLWKMPWILASPHRLLKWCLQSSYSSSATSHGRTGHSNHIFGPRPHSCILILHLHINPFPPLAPVVTGPCLHGNHAIFRSCRMVTTSLFPASLLESLCRTPVQSTKYSQTAHLLYSSGSLEMLQACIQVLMQWDLYICPTPKKKKKP